MDKFYKCIISVLLFVLAMTTTTYAQNDDACAHLAGTWFGGANVKLFIFSCKYDATVKTSEGNPAAINIDAVKSGGNFFCPKNIIHNAAALCDAGKLSIKDDKFEVFGELSADRRSANLTGTIYVLGRHPVNLTMHKL